ncbi:protein RD3-like [Dreissena polymorpha]|uniref:Protein RD3 n=1 Tax=Dreissena polymorpha TaxID=45954 RepID=A0A9D4MSA9_DREPO|nr:protein RD3-like [Dreissena polymorpha]KAH3880899.1 hypothetical protein DPMN_004821 [Dreissena polymorpha]
MPTVEVMFALKSIWKPWAGGESVKPPEKDEHMMIKDSILLELEYHIREQEQLLRARRHQEQRRETGVDYSWLVTTPVRQYEMSHLERLELEDLCYKLQPSECGKVIAQLRDAMLNEPVISDIPKILKACIKQVIEHRPKEETLSGWVVKRTASLASFKLRTPTKVTPCDTDQDDCESNYSIDTISSRVESASPPFIRQKSFTLRHSSSAGNINSLPV